MKNRTYTAKSFSALRKKKDQLLRDKKMIRGSSAIQFMDMIWEGNKKVWLMIYREPA